jgi:hypothetical protein
MTVLVALSMGTGYLFSIAATFLFSGGVFYEAAFVLPAFILGSWRPPSSSASRRSPAGSGRPAPAWPSP